MQKSRVLDRLSKLEQLPGVLPTAVAKSESLGAVAKSLKENDVGTAETASRAQLEGLALDTGTKDATSELYSEPGMREQVAGFASAGINFFHSDETFWKMAPAERAARGGNGSVTRVLLSGQRILLETQRIIVQVADGVSANARAAFFASNGLAPVGGGEVLPGLFRVAVETTNAVETCLALMERSEVVYAEPDFIEHIGQRHRPTDPLYGQQWHHQNIKCENAWDQTDGAGVEIAVIDNGFDTSHPDLNFGPKSGWYRPTPDFVDVDFVAGTGGMPDQNHGTACAGMINAREGNNNGGVGVAYGASLNMIACLPDQVGTQASLARAIAYAAKPDLEPGGAATGADVIACSLGPNIGVWLMSAVLSDALDFAATQGRGGKGCAIFWASTNGNFPISQDEVCSHSEVAAIGRSTNTDSDDGSGFGPKLEFLAPGVNVFIPSSGGGYATTTGTSFAAPCATGIAALALSQKPDLTAHELRKLMRDTCDKVGPLPYIDGHNIRFGHGRANAEAAVAEARRLAAGA